MVDFNKGKNIKEENMHQLKNMKTRRSAYSDLAKVVFKSHGELFSRNIIVVVLIYNS